jgi:flagellar biosynthesis protein
MSEADVAKEPRTAQAVALRYDPAEDDAPKVTAKGRGLIAERIIQLARAHQVPIREDRDLVQILSMLELNREIPPVVYQAVAEILAFIYKAGNRLS